MEFADLLRNLQRDAVPVVFINVLLQQLGLPVPAVPTLLLAGSIALGAGHLVQILAAAVLASVIADALWYLAGKRFGYRVLSGLCRLSINPSSCVTQAETRFIRWGVSSLVVAKFIPGFSTVAPPVAGALRMRLGGFLVAAGIGAALWAGLALGAGWWMRERVGTIIALMEENATSAVVVVAIVLVSWLLWKLWQKYRFQRLAELPHITLPELLAALASPYPPLLLDLRGPTMIAETGPIRGSRAVDHDRLLEAVADLPRNLALVTLCACPEDAGAVQAAQRLLKAGYRSVRPLRGGYEAWQQQFADSTSL